MTAVLLTVLGLTILAVVGAVGSMLHVLRDHATRLAAVEQAAPTPVADDDTQPFEKVIEQTWQQRQSEWLETEIAVIRERTRQRAEGKLT